MTEGVKDQETAVPEKKASGDKEYNFRRLEEERTKDREARIRSEMENEILKKELQEIKEYLKPQEKDPFDDLEEYVEPEVKKRFEAKFQKLAQSFERKAEEIAERKYRDRENERKEAEKKNFLPKLQDEFADYDNVMTEQNIVEFGNKDPKTLELALRVPDEYHKRRYLYEKIKEAKAKQEPSVQEKVQKNLKNPYFIQASATPTSNAIDFDLNAPGARQAAYQNLRNKQKQR